MGIMSSHCPSILSTSPDARTCGTPGTGTKLFHRHHSQALVDLGSAFVRISEDLHGGVFELA